MRLAYFGNAFSRKVIVALVILAGAAEPAGAAQFWVGKTFYFGEKSKNAPEGKSGNSVLIKLVGVTAVSYGLVRLSELASGYEATTGERWMYTALLAGSFLTGENLIPPPRGSSGTSQLITSSTIESRIDGTFSGWDGDTVFVLQNGQVWQQARYGMKMSMKLSPRVWIVKTGLHWTMKVEGVSDTVIVKPLR